MTGSSGKTLFNLKTCFITCFLSFNPVLPFCLKSGPEIGLSRDTCEDLEVRNKKSLSVNLYLSQIAEASLSLYSSSIFSDQFQALIQMDCESNAQAAKLSLDGKNVYTNCCTLRYLPLIIPALTRASE